MKKKLLKQIRQVANELPEMTYTSYNKEWVPQRDDYGQVLQTKPKLLHSTKVKRPVNHYRRLKRLVEKVGFDEGVKLYLRDIELSEK